jgi:prepilin-type N-terminal cleavage/methylation domain-containing protein
MRLANFLLRERVSGLRKLQFKIRRRKVKLFTQKFGRSAGFTLVEIMIVVSIIGLIAGIAIPAVLRARTRAQETTCMDNLRLLDTAKQQWALENRASSATTPQPAQIQPYIGRGTGIPLLCPNDSQHTFATSYSLNDASTPPTCLNIPTHVLQ